MATNNFLPFCPTDTGTNLSSQADYAAATDRTNGNQPGVASSKLNNKALRQSSFITSQIAQYLADKTGADVLDGGVTATLLSIINAAVVPLAPSIQKFLSGTGTMNKTYKFFITAGSATAAATYTNNGVTYTVTETIASGLILTATGNGAPAVSGTLTKTGGTGDATIAFQAVRAPLYLVVEMVGGGGGGAGSANATNNGGTGGNGGSTTFGSSLLTAAGGTGAIGASASSGGGGGSPTVNSPATALISVAGGGGGGSQQLGSGYALGGMGGSSALGGAGGNGQANAGGGAASANTGAGGGGASTQSISGAAWNAGAGGGSGAYVKAMITSPLSATYAYAVGAAGTVGSAGTGGNAGGAGAAGMIVVEEHFQ